MRIRIDDEPFEVDTPEMTMAQLLELAGVDAEQHYIQRANGNTAGIPFMALHDEVDVHDGDRFLTVYTGPCTAQ